MRISDFSVDRPVAISMMVLIIVVLGLLSLSRLGLDMMPDVDFPTVSVVTRFEGASSEDIERRVTRPIEGTVASVSGVTNVKSISREDVSYVLVEFAWGTDLDAAAQDLREALGLVVPLLPDRVEEPQVLKFSLSAFPVLSYGVTGMGGNTVALNSYLDDTLTQRIERLDGVAGVIMMGGAEREVQVSVDRTALESAGLSMQQLARALAAQNMDRPAGRVVEGREEYLVRTLGELRQVDDVMESVVGVGRDGAPVRVRDVADVRVGVEEERNIIRTNGGRALYVIVNKQSGANPLQVARKIKKELTDIRAELPGDIAFDIVMDSGAQIQLMATNVSRTGLLGGLLAIFFMFLFLRSVRPTLAIAAAIPLSLLVTFIPIYAMGETLNLMTMGGLMLGIGMLVDNAVVVIENVFRHLEMGKTRQQAAREGAREIAMAITASTLTTIAVFLPLFFGGGIAGELVRGLAMVVAFALGASLLVALTIIPMLAAVFFSQHEARKAKELAEGRFSRFQARYRRLLGWSLGHRKSVLALALVLFVGSLGLLPLAGSDFLPGTDQPIVMGLVRLPVGTPFDETDRAVRRIEAFAAQLPGIETVGCSVGVNEDDLGAGLSEFSPAGVHEAQFFIRLADERDVTADQVIEMLRDGAPRAEGVSVDFFDMGKMMTGGSAGKPIQVRITGPGLEVLDGIASDVMGALATVDGVADISSDFDRAKPERHLVIDRNKASSYGLSVAEIAQAVEAATKGVVVGQFTQANEEFLIRVRYSEEDRDGFDDLDRIVVPTQRGQLVPLRQVAEFTTGLGPVQIIRESGARQISVSASQSGRDLGTIIADADEALAPIRSNLPLGYRIDYGGTYEQMMGAFLTLLGALLLATLLVYMVMAAQFEAFVHPLVIMATVPLAMVGVSVALLVSGTAVSVVTFVGFIMLSGIVVNNGIVLIDYVNQLRRRGMTRREALIEGGATRLRAVLITSGTTISGLLPMALVPGRGAELTSDMAITVAGGLAASTLLTLLVLPVVYDLFDAFGERVRAFLDKLLHGRDQVVDLASSPDPAGVPS